MKISNDDIWKIIGLGALAASGFGLAGVGPLAGLLGGSSAAGAGGAAGAAAAGGLTAPGGALAGGLTGAGASGAGAASAGTAASKSILGSKAAQLLGGALVTQAAGLGINEAMPKYGMQTPVEVPPLSVGMDFNSLLDQGKDSKLPKMQMRKLFS